MADFSWGSAAGAARSDDDRVRGLIFVAVMVAIMWIEEIVDSLPGVSLDGYGIKPRNATGLEGIVFAPFLHGGFDHLIGNTVPFIVLGAMIALSGLARVAMVTVIVALVGGLGTWLIAPANSVHIGASGIVFGFATYLVARWIYTRRLIHVLAGLVVLAVWGGALLGGLVPRDGISWQGHLFGGVGGVVAAAILDGSARRRSQSGGFALAR
jgi:membrane associated rhomboid family serine protease